MITYNDLKKHLSAMGGVVIGYSGGVDSTLLAKAATEALGNSAVSVLIVSCLIPESEVAEAQDLAQTIGLNLTTITADALAIEHVAENPQDRCYYCKKALFSSLKDIAEKYGINYVVDGANTDDSSDYRPGTIATTELGVRSPFKELGMSKEIIRAISREIDLPTWDKPSYACLASRVPYGVELTPEILKRVEKAEELLRNLGFGQCRVRYHGEIARIEVHPIEMARIIVPAMREQIVDHLKTMGFSYVSLDLTGYRTGSMNETLSK